MKQKGSESRIARALNILTKYKSKNCIQNLSNNCKSHSELSRDEKYGNWDSL